MKFTTAFVAIFAAAVASEKTEAVDISTAVENATRADILRGVVEMQTGEANLHRNRREAQAQAKLAKKYELILASRNNLRH